MFDKLIQVPATEHPAPDGFGEVWVGEFDCDRRVEIVSELYSAIIPGIRHCVAYKDGSREVRGFFYVPIGQSIVGHITQHP